MDCPYQLNTLVNGKTVGRQNRVSAGATWRGPEYIGLGNGCRGEVEVTTVNGESLEAGGHALKEKQKERIGKGFRDCSHSEGTRRDGTEPHSSSRYGKGSMSG